MPVVLVLFLVGVVAVLWGIGITIFKGSRNGIWYTGAGTVFTVFALFLVAGFNNSTFYPSASDFRSSLTIYNASSSYFTLKTMMYVHVGNAARCRRRHVAGGEPGRAALLDAAAGRPPPGRATPAADRSTTPFLDDMSGQRGRPARRRHGHLVVRATAKGRLWVAILDLPEPLVPWLRRHGRPIRYAHVDRQWPISAYQNT